MPGACGYSFTRNNELDAAYCEIHTLQTRFNKADINKVYFNWSSLAMSKGNYDYSLLHFNSCYRCPKIIYQTLKLQLFIIWNHMHLRFLSKKREIRQALITEIREYNSTNNLFHNWWSHVDFNSTTRINQIHINRSRLSHEEQYTSIRSQWKSYLNLTKRYHSSLGNLMSSI